MEACSQRILAPNEDNERGSGWWIRIRRSILGTPSASRGTLPRSSKTSAGQRPADTTVVARSGTREDGYGTTKSPPHHRRTTSSISPNRSLRARRSNSRKRETRTNVERARHAQQLSGDVPLMWRFLREREGWSFVNQSSWDVCRPRRGDDTDVIQPLSQSQLPSYLVDHPTLLESYLLWRQELSGSVVRVDSDNGELDTDTAPFESEPTSPSRSRAEIAASSEPNLVSSRRWTSAHASPVRRDPNDAPSSTSSRMRWWMTPRRPDTAPQSTAGGTTVVSAEISKTNSTDMIVVDTHPTPGTGASATTLPSADDVVSGTPAIMTPTNAVATAIMDQDLNTDSSGLQQLSEAPTNSPTTADTDRDFDADGWERRTPHEQALRNPAVHLVGMDVDEDTTNSERPGARAGRRNEDTSPLWRRTRSRVASGPSSTSQGSGSARIVAGEGRNDGEILITQRLRPRVSTRGAVAIASRMEGRRSGIAERINGGGDDGPGRSGSGKTVRTATPRRGAASVASRRPAPGTRMVSPERAGREGSGRRAKRRARAEVEEEEEEESPPPSLTSWCNKPRIKIEGETRATKGSLHNRQCGAVGYVPSPRQDGSGERDDPFAAYALIELETVHDEGLEELLHNSRRNGYLDIRRYRKPGFPRPLRTTRIEANHGKRFHDHLLELLRDGKRLQAHVLLRQLEHFEKVPPDLAASLHGVACVPAWYQALAVGPDAAGVGEVFDLTAEEAEVIDCEKEPLDCVTWRVVKKEPVLPESGKRDEEGLGTTRAGTAAGESALDMSAARVKQELA